MFQNILFPYDGSEHSKVALNNVITLAKSHSAKVTLLNVFQVAKIAPLDKATYDYINEMSRFMEDRSNGILQDPFNLLVENDIPVEKIILEGHPRTVILDTIKEKNCDLVIMGSRGLGAIKSIVLGSVSHYIIHHTDIPVFITNNFESNFKHILFPIEGNEIDSTLSQHLIDMAKAYQAKVTVFHAWNTNKMNEFVDENHPSYHSLYELVELMRKDAQKKLFDVSRYIEQQGITVVSELYEGHTGEGILETSINHDCDLIIIGKHQRYAIERWLLGSSSLFVAHHSQCPVLFIKP